MSRRSRAAGRVKMPKKQTSGEPLPEQGAVAAPAGKLLTRQQAGAALGVSASTVRRYENVVAPVVGSDGVHRFTEDAVASLRSVIKRGEPTTGEVDGATAAEAFTMFDDGVHPVDVVKRLRVAPRVVINLRDTWAEMRGSLVMVAEQVAQLAVMTGAEGLETSDAVVEKVQALLARYENAGVCSSCKCERERGLCRACARNAWGPLRLIASRLEHQSVDGVDQCRFVGQAEWRSSDGTSSGAFPVASSWADVKHSGYAEPRGQVEAWADARSRGQAPG
jgi:hypothetical protein